ncbi:hypothetical protein, partial [Fusobacterium ulcerans]
TYPWVQVFENKGAAMGCSFITFIQFYSYFNF